MSTRSVIVVATGFCLFAVGVLTGLLTTELSVHVSGAVMSLVELGVMLIGTRVL